MLRHSYRFILLILAICIIVDLQAQCPQLNSNATLSSPDCVAGSTPCDVCPGDVITLTASGAGLIAGSCVNWYFGTTNNFNPYNGEGTLLGCSMIQVTPPNPCNSCPLTLGLFVDACGTEENNEFLAIYSGSGFFVDDLTVDFDAVNNNGDPSNADIGGGCSWQEPDPNVIASIQTICPGATVVGAGPGEAVPPGVPVIVFTSAGYDANYNFGNLCPLSPTIYVMQNGCTRSFDAFSNNGAGGTSTTTVSLACGCSDNTTYNPNSLPNSNGSFVTDANFPPFYGNSGCGFPAFPGIPGNPPSPITVLPLDVTITPDMCNGGPYYAVGIVEPLPPGCNQTFTNYLPFNVPCPQAVLGTAVVCENSGVYSLVQIQDPNVPNGTWSGPGVSGNNFNPAGLQGAIDLTFTPSAACGIPSSTTITVNAVPTATFEPVSIQCPGQNADLVVSFTGQAPWTFDFFAGGTFLGNFTTSDNPLIIPISPTSTTTYSIQNFSDALCAGANASLNVVVPPPPTAALSLGTPSTVCSGDLAEFQVLVMGGTGPYTIVCSIDGVPQAPFVTAFNPYTFYVTINNTTTVALESVDANGCQATVSGSYTIVVSSPLSAVISGGGQICQGGPGADITVSFNGSGPFTFTYTADNVLQPPVTTGSNPYIFTESPSSGTIYQLASVSNGICTGSVSGTAVIFVFTPSTAFLSGDVTMCNFADTTVMVDFTGTGPFELVYAIDNVPQPLVSTFDDPYFIAVNTGVNTVYSLVSVHSPGCTGSVSGTATITVNYPPAYTNLSINCNPANNDYTIEFDVTGATLPLTLLNGSGSFSGTHFTSAPLPQTQAFIFVFHDANDCGDITVAGPSLCNCVSNAGAMEVSDTLGACTGSIITAAYIGTPVLDADDSLRFVLHTTAGLPIGQILDWSATPSFGFLPGMSVNTLYYISAVAGDYAGSDSIDLADPCLSVSAGTPIVFYNPPTAVLGPDQTICSGAQVVLPVNFTGLAPFTLNYSIDGIPQTPVANITNNPFNLTLNPADTVLITLTGVSDQHCMSIVQDTLVVTVNYIPQITNLNTICDLQTFTYTVEFDVQGGAGPYTILGSGGALNGNHYVSTALASGQGYNFSLSDGNNCGFSMVSDTVSCACLTGAGAMDTALIKLCPGAPANAIHNGAQVLDNNDVLIFVLHTNAGGSLGTVLDTALLPSFLFDPSDMQYGSVYYISAVAGNPLGNGVDLSDPCVSITSGTPVIWNQTPTASLSGNYDVCPGQNQSLNITFTGQSPYNFSYTKNGILTSALALSNNYLLGTTLLQSTTFVLVSVSDVNCPGTASGQAVITVHPVPEIVNASVVCNPDNLHYTVEFDVQNADLPGVTVGGTLSGTFNASTGHFISSTGDLPAPSLFTAFDMWQCGTDTLSVTPDCSCVTGAGFISQPPLDVCTGADIVFQPAAGQMLDPNDVFQYILCADSAQLPQGILARSALPVFSGVSGLLPGQTYFILAAAGNPTPSGEVDFADPCVSLSPAVAVTIRELPTAFISGDTSVCLGSNFGFPVLFTGAAPFTFSYTINNGPAQPTIIAPQNTFAISTNNVLQAQVFNLVFVDDKYCSGSVSGTVTVNVEPGPVIGLSGDARLCPGDSALLSLSLLNALSCDFTITGTPSGGAQNFTGAGDGFTFAVKPGQTTLYTIQNVQVNGNACAPQISGAVQVSLSPLSVTASGSNYNGYGISCFGAADGSAGASLAGGFAPVSLLWSTNDTTPGIGDLPPGIFSVIATDAEGCTATDSVTLNEPEPLNVDWYKTDPDCRQGSSGSVTVLGIENGAGGYKVRINNQDESAVDSLPVTISGLGEGPVELVITDSNGCTISESDTIFAPTALSVEIGPDQIINPGDTASLTGIVSGNPVVILSWSPTEGLGSPASLGTWAAPANTTEYVLTVQDSAGCVASDAVTVIVAKAKRVFIPNLIKAGAGLGNDLFTVYGGAELVSVRYLYIFDRWGDHIFELHNFPPNNSGTGWDGTVKGKDLQPGVYAYIVEVEFQDGSTQVFTGGVTLVR